MFQALPVPGTGVTAVNVTGQSVLSVTVLLQAGKTNYRDITNKNCTLHLEGDWGSEKLERELN